MIELVASFGSPLRPEQIAETLTAKSARRYDPVMRHDPAATAPSSGAADLTPPRQPRQNLLASPAVSFPKFRGVEIGQADFNPLVGVGCPAYAEAVAVTNISNRSGERLAMPRRKASFAGVGAGHRGRRQREHCRGKDDLEHGSTLTLGGFGLVCGIRKGGRLGPRAEEPVIVLIACSDLTLAHATSL